MAAQPRIVGIAWSSARALSSKPEVKEALKNAAIDIAKTADFLKNKYYIGLT